MKPIYLDYNATTPILPEVAEAMKPFLDDYFGNPSSGHLFGVQSKEAIKIARSHIANILECHPEEVVFTSGGSESNNFAIKGIAFANRNKGNHIITSKIEHPAVIEVCEYLKKWGYETSYVGVDKYGEIDLEELEKSIRPKTILITIMHANNEVGTIQPLREISDIANKHSITFHSDGAQSMGKISTSMKELGVDLFSVAGHKLYGPKGIGVLYVKNGIQLEKFIHGANQEQARRAGTENIIEIVGLGKACEIAKNDIDKNFQTLKNLRDRLEVGLINAFKDQKVNDNDLVKINGHKTKRLPNTLSISFYGIESNTLLSQIENEIAASAGSACHSGDVHISDTLTAMNVPLEYASGTLRLSMGKLTTVAEIDKTIDVITSTVKKLLNQ